MIDAITKWGLVLFIVVIGQTPAISTPVWNPQAMNGDFGRNIRHLPCVSRRTGDTGVCMFAYSCAKANGTHLGTCIDRFFFGSCCKVPTSNLDLAAPLDSNNISEENVLGLSSTESYLLSTYQTVQLIKNSSTPYVTSTGKPIPDILPPVRKPSKPQITTNSPSKINTPKPPSIEVLNVSSTNLVFSKPTEPSYIASILTQKPTPSSPVTSPINNYSKPTKRPQINPNISQVKPAVDKPAPKPTPSIKPISSKPTGQIVVKPPKPPTKPALSNNKPSFSQTETKPTLPSKPEIATVTNKFKPSGNKTSNQTAQSPTKKPPPFAENKPATISLNKPPVKISKPTQKPLSTSKPISSTKPINSSKPSKPYINVSQKPSANSSISKPQNTPKPVFSYKPSPATKPPVAHKPINSSKPTVSKPSSPTYIKVPLTSTPPAKVTVPSTTISNEILPEIGNFSTVSSVEFEEEVSNLINGSPSPPTDIPPALVTWTTVDEVPVKPVSKPISTPTHSGSVYNKTKIPVFTTIPSTTAQSWVEVSVSTHEPSQSELGDLGITKPSTITTSPPKPLATASTSPVTTVGLNVTEVPPISVTRPNVTTEIEQSTEATTVTTGGLSSMPTKIPSTISTTEPDLVLQSNYSDNEIETTLLNTSNFVEVCGRRLFPQSRIVGGDKATFGKWPWQISLRQWRTSTYLHKCGAALLNENWAITAAHCVENVPPSDLLLRLGEHDLSLEDEPYGYQERRVQIVASHPQFDSRTFEYDLALLRFYEPVTFQPNVIPVCVPQDDTNFVGSTAYVTGWGRLYEDGPLPSVLQEVSVPVINNTVCETMYRAAGYIEHIPEIFICAGWKKGGFDSCEGDSGGPMVIQRPDKRWLLAGVISWGIGCAEPNQPGVYTRISEFREWINQILQF